MKPRTCAARLLRISAANIRPNRFHQDRTVPWADVDPALGQQILDVAQRQRISHVHHHDQTVISGELLKYRNGLLIV
jgi:hypothetical protein